MKLYSVYEYDYNDSHMHGLFSSREKALAYVNRVVEEGRVALANLEIQEWEVDDLSAGT